MVLIKSFSEDSITQKNKLSNATIRKIKAEYPEASPLLGKEDSLLIYKTSDKLSVILRNNIPIFILLHTKALVPALKAVHLLPSLLPKAVVDRGAIKHIINGANVMAPGLLKQGSVYPAVEKGAYIAIYGEGMTCAMAVGTVAMGSSEVHEKKTGVAIELVTHLGDSLYNYKQS